ncbi:MAG: M20/M25/M40 family metallo-hydrolase [Steroidobacteraceae bacterium]|nr:M20/M25/M40 family metallo-hydrolase [Steroidobacteraceae bacterium]
MPLSTKTEVMSTLLLAAGLTVAAHAAETPALTKSDLAAATTLRSTTESSGEAYAVLESLTTEVGARLAGSAGDRAAVAWAERELKRLGLANVRTQEVMVPQWVRGEIEARVTAPFPQALAAAALGGSVGTAETGIEAEVVQFTSLEDLKKATREQVAGRIVFVNKRLERAKDGRGYGVAVPVRLEGASVASNLGAQAIVIRSMSTSQWRLPHTGTVSYAVGVPRIPAVAVSNPDADQLERMFARNQPVRLQLRVTARELPMTKSANVIGEIVGGEKPQEVVVLGAHLDSWDLGTGAIDDGAGVAIVSAAVAQIRKSGLKPKRTIRVVLFANEEFGLSGGSAYGKQTPEELANHVVAMEADFGGARVYSLGSQVAPEHLPAVREIARALAPLGVEFDDRNKSGGGADISPLRRQGVPVFALNQDGTLYFDYHHTANDTLDKVDPKALAQSTAAYAVTAWLAAQAEGGFGRLAPPQ